jgi:hypothetical protein
MSDRSMGRITLEREILRVEEEIAHAFVLNPPSIARRIELEATLERLNRRMALV